MVCFEPEVLCVNEPEVLGVTVLGAGPAHTSSVSFSLFTLPQAPPSGKQTTGWLTYRSGLAHNASQGDVKTAGWNPRNHASAQSQRHGFPASVTLSRTFRSLNTCANSVCNRFPSNLMSSSASVRLKTSSLICPIRLLLSRKTVNLFWSANTLLGSVSTLLSLRSRSASRLRLSKLEPCSVAMALPCTSKRISSNNRPKASRGTSCTRLWSKCRCLSSPSPRH